MKQGPIDRIRQRLADHEAFRVEDARVARAAVAMILKEVAEGIEILLIRRATRDGDPWSGHMAFPGGRRDPDDPDVVYTALRETREEVGIDLFARGEVIGRLDELRAVARHRPLDLVISPIVCVVFGPVRMRLDPTEVESAFWAPLSFFRDPDARCVYHRELDGVESEFPAYRYENHLVWGLTHAILAGFLTLTADLAEDGEVGGRAAEGDL